MSIYCMCDTMSKKVLGVHQSLVAYFATASVNKAVKEGETVVVMTHCLIRNLTTGKRSYGNATWNCSANESGERAVRTTGVVAVSPA